MSSGQTPPFFLVLTMKWGQMLPPVVSPLACSLCWSWCSGRAPGTGTPMPVSRRDVAPGPGSAIVCSSALRQGGNCKDMGASSMERQSARTWIFYGSRKISLNKYLYRIPTLQIGDYSPFYPTGFNLLPEATQLTGI